MEKGTIVSDDDKSNGDMEAIKKKLDTNAATTSDKKKKSSLKRKGRKGDPRMHKAVAARMADPTMTLLDALRAGGFNYPLAPPDAEGENASNSMYNVEDEEGVQLGQRKNQLSRRLRHLIRKGESGGGYSDSDLSSKKKEDSTEGEEESDDDSKKESSSASNGIGASVSGLGIGNTNGLSNFNYNPYTAITSGLDPMATLHIQNNPFNHQLGLAGLKSTSAAGLPSQQTMQQQLAYQQFQSMRQQQQSGSNQGSSVGTSNTGQQSQSSSQQTPLTNNTNTSNSRGFLLALQQQHLAAAAAANASRTNLAMHNNLLQVKGNSSDSNSLSSFVNNLYNGLGSASGISGIGGDNAHLLSNKIMNNLGSNPHGAILDNFMQNSMRSDMSSISSTFGLSKFSRGSKDANSDVSSFLNACKKIHSDISWHGKEDKDLSCCSTFGASTKTTNEMSGSNSTSQELTSPLFREFSSSISNLSNFHNMTNTNRGASLKFNPTSTDPASTEDGMNLEALHENVRKDMEKFNNFHKYLETQQSVVTDLLSIVGKLPDESKMRKAVDFYRVESTTLMKSSMIKAGFSPEQTEECDKNYLGFVARKLDHEIRRVKRLTNEMKQRMAMNQQQSGEAGDGNNDNEGSNKRLKMS